MHGSSGLGCLCALLMTCIGGNLFAAELPEHRVENLDYGRALFQYFQDDKLAAITRLMIAEERPRSRDQIDEANLLRADLYYGYGLYEESRELFTQLLSTEVSESIQNRIWFNLARLRYEQGYNEPAHDLLSRITDRLPAAIESERKYLLTNLHIDAGQYDQATKTSSRIHSRSIWKIYARYNLGVSLMENGDYEQGRRMLDRIGQIEARSPEMQALRDRANLSLGLKQLRMELPEKALENLSRIRLEGPLSNFALLASGWAWYRMGDFEKAQTPWQILLQRNAVDAATQEAILAIPANYAELGYDKLALRHYEAAAKQFELQLQVLDNAIKSIESDGLIAALRENAILYDRHSLQRLPPSSDVTPQLHELLASTRFQLEIRRYQELLDIRSSLRYWATNFPALELMLAERRKNLYQKLPLLQQSSSFDQLDQMKERRDQYAEQLLAIHTGQQYEELANPVEREQLERLQRVAAAFDKVGPQLSTPAQRDMHRLLSGLLHYNMETDFPTRFWKARKQLNHLDRALLRSRKHISGLSRITHRTSMEFGSYQNRIVGQTDRISHLHTKVSRLLALQEQHINQLAIDAIRQQQQHVLQLRLNTRFELAKLYDRLTAE